MAVSNSNRQRTRALFRLLKAQSDQQTKSFLRERLIHRFSRGLV